MALVFMGKTPCGVCGAPIREGEDCVAFPAFLPRTHRLWKYSDGVFHSKCFANEPNSDEVQSLYLEFRSIWEKCPSRLRKNSVGRLLFAPRASRDLPLLDCWYERGLWRK
jgi:hypothetical protein